MAFTTKEWTQQQPHPHQHRLGAWSRQEAEPTDHHQGGYGKQDDEGEMEDHSPNRPSSAVRLMGGLRAGSVGVVVARRAEAR